MAVSSVENIQIHSSYHIYCRIVFDFLFVVGGVGAMSNIIMVSHVASSLDLATDKLFRAVMAMALIMALISFNVGVSNGN